jgi:hypothetical protein
MDEQLTELILELPCPYCSARRREWCITSGGRSAAYLHADRQYEINQAFGHGYHQGWTEGVEVAERRARASA